MVCVTCSYLFPLLADKTIAERSHKFSKGEYKSSIDYTICLNIIT